MARGWSILLPLFLTVFALVGAGRTGIRAVLTSTRRITMKRLYLASTRLAAVILFATVSFATAAYDDTPSADPTPRSVSAYGLNDTEPPESKSSASKETEAKTSLPAARPAARVQIGPVCQTLAGPACPIGIIVPVGSPRHVFSALRRIGRSGTLSHEQRRLGAAARSGRSLRAIARIGKSNS